MERDWTLVATATGLALVVWSLWGTRRRRPFGRVSWVPWHGIMFAGLVIALFGAVHLLTLAKPGGAG